MAARIRSVDELRCRNGVCSPPPVRPGLEHAASDELIELIEIKLGDPVADPHGDPIPRGDGPVLEPPVETPARPLAECAAGTRFRLARVLDQSSEFLRYLTDSGLALGATGTVEKNPDGAGLMRISVNDKTNEKAMSLSLEAAGKLLVGDADSQ